MPAVREEQDQVQREPAGRGQAGEQPRGGEQPDHDLEQRHRHPGELRVRDRERPEQEATRRSVSEALELGADVRRRAGMEEAGVAQLLDTGVDERNAEEEPQQRERSPGRDVRDHPLVPVTGIGRTTALGISRHLYAGKTVAPA